MSPAARQALVDALSAKDIAGWDAAVARYMAGGGLAASSPERTSMYNDVPSGWPNEPDPEKTPGLLRDLTDEEIISTKWGKDRRKVTDEMKQQAFEDYGLKGRDDKTYPTDKHGRRWQIDHLIPRQFGGADDLSNLWPLPYNPNSLTPPMMREPPGDYDEPWNSYNVVLKDITANKLMNEVRAGRMTLDEARSLLAGDWREVYRSYYGEPPVENPYVRD